MALQVSTRLAIAAAAAAVLLSCFGRSEQRVGLDQEPGRGNSPQGGGNLAPPPLGLRRLVAAQYRRAIRDLLGPEAAARAAPPPDVAVNGFRAIGAAQLALAPSAVDAYERSAVAVAEEALRDAGRRERIVGCAPSEACMEAFVARFGRRAFRRTLTPEERSAWTALGNEVAALVPDFTLGATAVIAGMLQSPQFLHLVEVGEPDPDRPGVQRLTGPEVAARMALFLQGSIPDEALLAAAERGELDTEEGVRHHAWRLLLGPGAREALRDFLDEHLKLEGLAVLSKDPVLFPQYSPALAAAMREETLRLWERVVWEADRDVRQVLTERSTFVDGPLADLYGVPRPPGGGPGQVELPAETLRAGFLGHASFLALNAHPGQTSPTYRGLFVRERLLCETVDLPPGNVNTSLPPPQGAVTMRERLRAHREDPACAGCHVLMDDIGLGLENFDALGQFRTTDQGVAIDASASVDRQPFAGAAELGEVLAADPRVSRCLQRSLFRFATGHVETHGEALAMVALEQKFAASGYRLRQLLVDLVASEAFRKGGAAP